MTHNFREEITLLRNATCYDFYNQDDLVVAICEISHKNGSKSFFVKDYREGKECNRVMKSEKAARDFIEKNF